MKSKICLCDRAILWKDLTRFAPLVLLTGLILWIMGMGYYEMTQQMGEVASVIEPVQFLGNIAPMLGYISSLLLFAYLTKKRECDAMHALPLRRESMFFTHCIAALLQFAVPYGIAYAILPGQRGWLVQMAVTFCLWLFSFGMMTFSMMLGGRKLAGILICGMIYDLPSTVYMVADSLYIPQLPGLYLDMVTTEEQMRNYPLVKMDYVNDSVWDLLLSVGGYALGGIAFLAAALFFYRRRKLERAGDFVAEKWLEPVFAWGFGISVAVMMVSISVLLGLSMWIFLVLGLMIGYFAARMFFARSVKVFDKQTLAGAGLLLAVVAGSVFVVSLDPLGAVTRVPEAEQIESITIHDSSVFEDYYYANTFGYKTSDPEEVDRLRQLHKDLIADLDQEDSAKDFVEELMELSDDRYFLTYQLRNGATVKRAYTVSEGPELDTIAYFLSQPENLLGTADLQTLLDTSSELRAFGVNGGEIHTRKSFFTVFLADCEAGRMYSADGGLTSAWTIYMDLNVNGESVYISLDVPSTAEDTVAWLDAYFGKH